MMGTVMDDTWRKALGTKIADDGSAIRLGVQTVDGRTMEVQLVPEMVTALVAELINAKTKANIAAAGGRKADPLDPTAMRQPIAAERLVQTDYVSRGGSLVQVITAGGGVFEFLIPLGNGIRRELD
jgi:hypothetical protein